MKTPHLALTLSPSRRRFLLMTAGCAAARGLRAQERKPPVFSAAEGGGFRFDTGRLRGQLRTGGRSQGLHPVSETAGGTQLSGLFGFLSPYRLLDAGTRYGASAWDRKSTAKLRGDGAVEVEWPVDEEFPFTMTAVYRWAAEDAADLTLRVTAAKALPRFEVFLATYFDGFPDMLVPVPGQKNFAAMPREAGVWQMFPRDEAAKAIIGDGRYKRSPHPVDWAIRPAFAAPLAMRRDAARGLEAVVMARPDDCFAISGSFDGEAHRSVYLSLFGKDLAANESLTAECRIVIGRQLGQEGAMQRYHEFLADEKTRDPSEKPAATPPPAKP